MPKIVILAVTTAAFSAALTQSSLAQQRWDYGCFRWGETGHHWYNFCVGPDFLYPHHRNCDRNVYCWYS